MLVTFADQPHHRLGEEAIEGTTALIPNDVQPRRADPTFVGHKYRQYLWIDPFENL